jgi:1-acyl-sn-glycerol-3-phosphate acyltransferase
VRIESVDGLENVPADGPAILMMNHIAFVDPLVLVHTTPRDIVPLAKTEAYNYPLVGIFPKIWGVIPVERQGIDRKAVQQALAVLSAGEILLVAPEGTRYDALTAPKEGAAYLASRSGAPIIPVALEHTRGFPTLPFTSRWRAPGAEVHYGRPFRVRAGYRKARGPGLKQVLDESMFVLAGMLPKNRRGEYADLSRATMDTIEWL